MAVIFTSLQILWSIWWLLLHMRIRRSRTYAVGKESASKNRSYRRLQPFMYVCQLGLSIGVLWSNADWLLKFHDSDQIRICGFALLYSASLLYRWALIHLGSQYSPCYDLHTPTTLVTSGPYRWMKHPMYSAKIAVGIATLMISGTWWFVVPTFYLFWATIEAMIRENKQLERLRSGEKSVIG